MRNSTSVRLCVVGLFVCAASSPLHAASLTWTSAVSGSWSDPARWTPNQAPMPGDVVNITVAGTYTITITGDASVAVMNLGGTGATPTISGTGTLTITSTLAWASGGFAGGGITTLPIGTTTTISGTANKTLNNRTFNAGGTTTWTAGTLSLSNGATFSNTGTFSMQITSGSVANGGGTTPTFSNSGTFNKDMGAVTIDIVSAFNNSGALNITAGSLRPQSGGSIGGTVSITTGNSLILAGASGTYTLANGGSFSGAGTLRFERNTDVSGTVSATCRVEHITGVTLGGTGTLNADATYDWSGGLMSGSGSVVIGATGTMILTSATAKSLNGRALTNNGAINWMAGQLNVQGGSVFTNGVNGQFNMMAGGVQMAWLAGLQPSFVNNGTLTKSSAAGMVTVSCPVTNSGTFDIQTGTLRLTGIFTNFSAGTLTGGRYLISSDFSVQGAGLITNAAEIVLNGAGSTFTDSVGGNALTGFANNAAAGILKLQNGRVLNRTGAFTNAGDVRIESASSYSATGNYTQSGGTTRLDSGNLAAAAIAINGGTLRGNGTVTGAVTNAGQVAPGLSAGTLTVNGSYTQAAGGTYAVELGGLIAGTEFDQLVVSGAAGLAGTITVSLIDPYVPNLGDTFQVVLGAPVSGTFPTVTTVGFPPSMSASVTYSGTTATVVIGGAVTCGTCKGDMDASQFVNGDDIQAFIPCLLSGSAGGACGCADFNGDNTVDAADLDLFVQRLTLLGTACGS